MYNPKSKKAEEFIDHQEILDTIEYAMAHRSDRALIESILAKAEERKGLGHRAVSYTHLDVYTRQEARWNDGKNRKVLSRYAPHQNV